ncbi:hypothetical protein KAS31_04675 [Candidatus Parcubacteria bacterium]|nr:hypothetical protein [Candidatus Parcubacteria bacterium]
MNKKIAIIFFLSIFLYTAQESKADWINLNEIDKHEAAIAEYERSQCPNGEKTEECCTISHYALSDCKIYAQDEGYYVLDSFKYTYKYCKKDNYLSYHLKEFRFILFLGMLSFIGLLVIRRKHANNIK